VIVGCGTTSVASVTVTAGMGAAAPVPAACPFAPSITVPLSFSLPLPVPYGAQSRLGAICCQACTAAPSRRIGLTDKTEKTLSKNQYMIYQYCMSREKSLYFLPVKKRKCLRCRHEWTQRGSTRPKECPACTNRKWDILDTRKIHTCLRCGYTWKPKTIRRPRQCPGCKQTRWDVPAGKLKRGRPRKRTD
jgi:predicted Zn-ribbon and HTH transcriptional regulator